MSIHPHLAALRVAFSQATMARSARDETAFAEREARIARAGYDYFRALAAAEAQKGQRDRAARFEARATDHAFHATLAAAALQHLAATSFRAGPRRP